jgi:inosose dehydratase
MKLAAAPISWGVCEVPDWGIQLTPDRVFSDMRALGIVATEAGPPGFLPTDAGAARSLLESRGLRLVGGFVTAVLHDPSRRGAELASVARQADWLAGTGAEVLVLAAASGRAGYSGATELADEGWRVLFDGVDRIAEVASRRGLDVAIHPHFGTMIERPAHVGRFLDASAHPLCLDTGHLALGGADPVKVARDAGKRVRHVHLKDVKGELASQVRDGAITYSRAVRRGLFVPLGDGAARIADVLALLREANYGGWYVLEQDVMLDRAPDEGPPDWVARSIEYARRHV